jgi:hypothetical protein
MDIGKALGFVFEDEAWIKKILIGAVIMLVPIAGQLAIVGYALALIRNVMAGDSSPLPEWQWDNLVGYLVDGLKLLVVNLIYGIPVLIFSCPAALSWGLMGPLADSKAVDTVGTIAMVLSGCGGCLVALYAIMLWLLTPALQIRFAESGEIGACLKFGEMFRFALANIGSIAISQLLGWAASAFILPIVGSLSFGILALPATVLIKAFSSHLYGQIGQQAA